MKGFRKWVLLCSLLIVTCSLAFAQTAQRIAWLLEQEHVSYAHSALLVFEAADLIDPAAGLSPEQAFAFALENELLPRGAQANQAVTMRGLSFMIMRAFDLKGGFFYTMTKSQHHAYRELLHRGIIQGRADPFMLVPGDKLLFVVSRTLFLENR